MSESEGQRHCLHCGAELRDAHGHRRYCGDQCYRSAAEVRRRQRCGIDSTPKRRYISSHAGSAVAGIMSFAAIGAQLGLSHECVRAIYLSAIAKLKADPRTSHLLAIVADLDEARCERMREASTSKPAPPSP